MGTGRLNTDDSTETPTEALKVRWLGRRGYEDVWRAMQRFTEERGADTPDELWLVEHAPVFTLGRHARHEHVLDPGDVPVVATDRGGQVTYHGPGQAVVYALLDLRRRGLGVRGLVDALELAVVDLLAEHGIEGRRRRDAPGVYVDDAKIAALGLRVRRGCAYHGLALNVAMDLSPFGRIDPCGFAGLAVTQLADRGAPADLRPAAEALAQRLAARLGDGGVEMVK